VELADFSPQVAPLEEFQDGKINILFLGRAEKRKGLEYLLKAFQVIKPDHPNCRLIVVSPKTRSRRKFEKQAAEANLKDVVFVDGRAVSDLQKPRYYSSADIFCAPATGRESFGLVLLEAMATGKPVVASNISGYASVVTHDSEGILVPPKQEVPLAQAITRLMMDEGLRRRMGEKGRAKAAGFGWEEIACKVMDYYNRVLNAKAERARTSIDNKKIVRSDTASVPDLTFH
jgi:phosphatidylinositol alpha-mannosyltransferase